jgi:hypothetical protein
MSTALDSGALARWSAREFQLKLPVQLTAFAFDQRFVKAGFELAGVRTADPATSP